jgi:tetratricopeptide (TPR) repeat protein
MSKKKFVWKKQYTPVAVALGVVFVALFALRMVGKARVVNALEQIQAQKGPQAKFFLSPNASQWASRMALPVEDRNIMAAVMNPAGVWVVSSERYLDSAYLTDATLSRCVGGGFVDLFQKCGPGADLYVLRFVGDPAEVNQARQLEGQGKFGDAKNVLDAYLNRFGGPTGAHGVAFYVGVVAAKAGDVGMMERMYDGIGPYHPTHLQVLYNWGLAKLYARKPNEAVTHLERAGKLAPDDAGVQLMLGDAYTAAGKMAKAKAIADRMAKLYPNDENVKRKQQDWSKN